MKKSTLLALALVVTVLTACMLPKSEDPFERLPEENLETIAGKLFPFSVSVATRATHRLEQDGKLVGYLASDLVQLAEFEGQEVILEGVWRNEKMRQIFWVEGIKVASLMENEDPENEEPQRFTTKKFTMLVPPEWEYSLAPNGVAYFLNKEDPARRVFLTFAVEDYSPESGEIVPNITMNGFQGMKEVTTDESGKEREIITLFSNIEPKKYVFTATYFFDDFEIKTKVFEVLQSFVEGEDAVQEVVIAEQKAKAEAEAAKLAAAEAAAEEQAESEAEAMLEENEEETSAVDRARGLLGGLLNSGDDEENETDPSPAAEIESETESNTDASVSAPSEDASTVVENTDYTNLIDDRAFNYESNLGFTLQVPYGNWFRNFGAYDGALAAIGVAKNPVETPSDVQMWVRVLPKDQPTEGITELITGAGVTLLKRRDENTIYELTGPVAERDTLWSIADSIR